MKLKAMKTVWIVRKHNGFNDYMNYAAFAARAPAERMQNKFESKGIICWIERFRVRKSK